jgi:hypothetical protein
MKIFRFGMAAVLLALSALSALVTHDASAATNLVTNGDFSDKLNGWTVYRNGRPDQPAVYQATDYTSTLGIHHFAAIQCDSSYCPQVRTSNSISQQINGLVTGHKYELTFFASGYTSWIDSTTLPPPSFGVQFGGATPTAISLPAPNPLNYL